MAAIIGNVAIAAIKFVAGSITGSSAMISEGIHSLVDTGNGGLLYYGLNRGARPADEHHPFGHGMEVYFWSLIVAVSIFGIGGGMSIYEGINHIRHPITLHNPTINYIVLGVRRGVREPLVQRRLARLPRDARRAPDAVGHPSRQGSEPLHRAVRGHGGAARPRGRFRRRVPEPPAGPARPRRARLGGDRLHPRVRRAVAGLREPEPARGRGGGPGDGRRTAPHRARRPGRHGPRRGAHDAPRPRRRAPQHRGAVHAGAAGRGDPRRGPPHRGGHQRALPGGEPHLHRGGGAARRVAGRGGGVDGGAAGNTTSDGTG